MNSSRPLAPSCCSGLVALATLAAAWCMALPSPALASIGAYVTPALVGGTQPNYWALYIYLAVVHALRPMRWRACGCGAGWRSPARLLRAVLDAGRIVRCQCDCSAFLPRHCRLSRWHSAFIVAGFLYGPPAERGRFDRVSCGVLAGYLLGAFLLVVANRHDAVAVMTLLALCAATITVAWRSETVTPAVAAAALLALLVIGQLVDIGLFRGAASRRAACCRACRRCRGSKACGCILSSAPPLPCCSAQPRYFAQGRVVHPYAAIIWAATGVLTPIVTLVALNYGVTLFERSIPFAALALLLAALFGIATETLNRRAFAPGSAAASAIFACGAVASLALALTFALERGWLTVALVLMVPGIAYIADKRPLPMLRQLCIVLTILVMARIAIDPRIVGDDVGKTPILNWLLWGYGVPALSFWIAGIILRKRGDDHASRSVDAAAITFTALTAMLEIRHLMNDGDIYNPSAGLGETGLQVSTGLAMTIGLEHPCGAHAAASCTTSARASSARCPSSAS